MARGGSAFASQPLTLGRWICVRALEASLSSRSSPSAARSGRIEPVSILGAYDDTLLACRRTSKVRKGSAGPLSSGRQQSLLLQPSLMRYPLEKGSWLNRPVAPLFSLLLPSSIFLFSLLDSPPVPADFSGLNLALAFTRPLSP